MNSENNQKYKLRFNITSAIVYIIGIVLLAQLFNMQIVHGKEYKEQSNTRLTRESTIKAARGSILDSSGQKLATTVAGYGVEIYRTKINDQELNNALLNLTIVFEANGDHYSDNLPITLDPFAFTIPEEDQPTWKKKYKIDETFDAENSFNSLKTKYKITNEDIYEARKIMTLRYELERKDWSSTNPITIANNISEISLATINEQSYLFPGVSVITNPTRIYPSNTLASHIIGYTSSITEAEYNANKENYNMNDDIGKSGIEKAFEKYLKGTDGIRQIDMAVDGTVTDEYVTKEAVSGANIVLTIDSNLQNVTENTLAATINGMGIEAGSAVVMNVKTGEVLALASFPDYNPNDFVGGISAANWEKYNSEDSNNPLFNRAIQSTNSPGSTFKPCTALTGLETGEITPSSTIRCRGVYNFSRTYNPVCWIWSDYHGTHGSLNVTQAIEHSCNYFFYEVGNRVGGDNLAKYAHALGLGKKTGIELSGEEAGYVASPETSEKLGKGWGGGDALVAAIGQGDNSFTTLQMAKYTSIIANGGNPINVTIVKSVISSSGEELNRTEVENAIHEKLGYSDDGSDNLTFDENNINAIKVGMRGVTSDGGGTAYSIFRGLNVEVGGKTGSAQTGIKGRTNAWFIGFAPYDDPQIAVVVMLENGQAGAKAAVTVRDIIAQYFGMNSAEVGTENMAATPLGEIQN